MSALDIKSIKAQIEKEYKYRTELHAHTAPVSRCSEIAPEEMVKIYHEKGYDAIVITNHFIYEQLNELSKKEAIDNYLEGFEQTKKAAQQYGITVLLGAEIRFTENVNDYLIYGVDREILEKCFDCLQDGIENFRKTLPLPQSVFIQAHPCRKGMVAVDSSLLDGYETFNLHPGHNGAIGLAVKCAAQNKAAVKTAGSDFHHKNRGHEAVSALRTKTLPKDSFELAEILKSGDYAFEIGEDAIVLP